MFKPRFRPRVEKEILVEVPFRFGTPTVQEVHQPPSRVRQEIAWISPQMHLAIGVMVGISLAWIRENVDRLPGERGGIQGEGLRVIALSVARVPEMVIRRAAHAVGRRGVRVEPDGLVEVVDRATEVMQDMAGRAAVPVGPGRARIERDCPVEVGDRAGVVFLALAGKTPVPVRLGVAQVQRNRPVVIGDRSGVVFPKVADIAPVLVGPRRARISAMAAS